MQVLFWIYDHSSISLRYEWDGHILEHMALTEHEFPFLVIARLIPHGERMLSQGDQVFHYQRVILEK